MNESFKTMTIAEWQENNRETFLHNHSEWQENNCRKFRKFSMKLSYILTVQDVQSAKKEMSDAQAENFLVENKARIEAAMCRAAFQTIKNLAHNWEQEE